MDLCVQAAEKMREAVENGDKPLAVLAYAETLSALGHQITVSAPMNGTDYRGGYPFDLIDYASIKVPTAPRSPHWFPQWRHSSSLCLEKVSTKVPVNARRLDTSMLFTNSPNVQVHSFANSAAQGVAKELKIPFVAVDPISQVDIKAGYSIAALASTKSLAVKHDMPLEFPLA